MSDNTVLAVQTGGDTIRDLARQLGSVKTQVCQLDIGGASANAEVLVTAGQQTMAASLPVVIASNQTALAVGGQQAAGAAPVGNPVLMAGSDGSLARTMKLATDGTVLVNGVQDSRTAGTITTATSVVGPVSVVNRNVVTFSISGTYAGVAFVIEATDNGSNWYGLQCMDNATGKAASSWSPASNASASYDTAVGGYTQVRIRATSWSSGTVNVGVSPQVFAYDPVVAAISQGLVAQGVTSVSNPVLSGGIYESTLPTLTAGTVGTLHVTTKGELLSAISSAGNLASVKPSSTAAAATDPALVVAVSPNNVLKVGDGTIALTFAGSNAPAGSLSTSTIVALSPNSGLPVTNQSTGACSAGPVSALTVANVKISGGNVFGLCVKNTASSDIFIQFYNTAGPPILGTGVLYWVPVAKGASLCIPPGVFAFSYHPIGIGIGASTTATGTGTPDVPPDVVIFYK